MVSVLECLQAEVLEVGTRNCSHCCFSLNGASPIIKIYFGYKIIIVSIGTTSCPKREQSIAHFSGN